VPELGDGITVVALPDTTPTTITLPAPPSAVTVLPVPGTPGPPGPAGDDPVALAEAVAVAVGSHANAPLPHPVYDDMPDFVLLFENGLI